MSRLPLANRMQAVAPPGTSSMRSKANAMRAQGIEIHNFAAGELFFDASEGMKRHAIRAVENRCNRYTPPLGMPQLRELLAQHVSRRCGVAYDASEVAVTCGAKQALFNAALILLNPGDEVLMPVPYWETFPTQIRLAGAKPVRVDTRARSYRLHVDDLKSAVSERTKMIVLNTPNNPTGVVYDAASLRSIGEFALRRGLWVVFDECYGDLVRPGHTHTNIVTLLPELKPQTLIVNSFSKTHAVTGWRIGYAAGPAHLIEAMHNLQGHTTSNPSTLSQHGALGVLQEMDDAFISSANDFLARQLQAALAIAKRIEGVAIAPAEGAFYLYIDAGDKIGRHFEGAAVLCIDHLAEILLTKARSAVVPGSAFGDPTGFRISYALEPASLDEGLSNICDVLNAIR